MQKQVFILLAIVGMALAGPQMQQLQKTYEQQQHQRQQPQQTRQCSRREQNMQFNDLEQVFAKCHQQCEQNKPSVEETREQHEQIRGCLNQHTAEIQENIRCINEKLQQQQTSVDGQQGPQVPNQDSNAKIADQIERVAESVRQQLQETYEQQEQQPENQQRFGKVLTNQVFDCAHKCFVVKARQMDNQQKYNCELKMDTETLKQAVGQCSAENMPQALDNVCQCALQQQKQYENTVEQLQNNKDNQNQNIVQIQNKNQFTATASNFNNQLNKDTDSYTYKYAKALQQAGGEQFCRQLRQKNIAERLQKALQQQPLRL